MNDQPRQRIIVDAVAFGQIFQFHRILKSITQAMQPTRLVVALLMVLTLVAVGNLWDRWFEGEGVFPPQGILVDLPLTSDIEADAVLRPIAEKSESVKILYDRPTGVELENWSLPARLDPRKVREGIELDFKFKYRNGAESGLAKEILDGWTLDFRRDLLAIDSIMPRRAYEATVEQVARSVGQIVWGVYTLSPVTIYGAFNDMIVRMPVKLWRQRPWFVVVYGFLTLLVLSVGGGAICRMSACETAGQERLRVSDAFDFALSSWPRLLFANLLPLLIAGGLALVLVVAGIVLFGIPYLDVLGGIGYGLNLLLGFLIAFVLLGTAGSFFLLLPAVATENCAPIDALQRAIAYLIGRPLHLLGYAITAIVGMSLGYWVVSLVAVTALNVTGGATGMFTSNTAVTITGGYGLFWLKQAPGAPHMYWHSEWAAFFVAAWQGVIVLLVASYVVSYAFSSITTIYLLMRKAVDDQDISEIWRPGLIPGTLAPEPTSSSTNAPGETEAATNSKAASSSGEG